MAAPRFIGPCRRSQTWTARTRLLCSLAVICIAPCLAGTTYKWVDEHGQVHYTDTPPSGTAYETVEAPPGPSVTPPVRAAPEPASTQTAPPAVARATSGTADDARCVDVLYQIKLLSMQRRVFKPGPGGTRLYLDDRDRPAELERLSRARDEICSDDTNTRKSQDLRAGELLRLLSPACTAAREKLQNMEAPDSHSVRSDIERQRAFVDKYCPDVHREDVWLGDWVLVRPRHL